MAMNRDRRWLAFCAFPLALLLFYEVYVFVAVFAFGVWDPKFGQWGTVELMQGIGIIIVGLPSVIYALGLAFFRQQLQAFSPNRIAISGVLAAAALIFILFVLGSP